MIRAPNFALSRGSDIIGLAGEGNKLWKSLLPSEVVYFIV